MIYIGDCLEVLKDIADNSIDSIVTDPPYGISFMAKRWDYDVPSVEVWRECMRVLKPGGHMLVACGTRTQHRMAVNIEDAGFEIRDVVTWLYGQGFPKSQNISLAIDKKLGVESSVVGDNPNKRDAHRKGGAGFDKDAGSEPLMEMNLKRAASAEGLQWEGWGTAIKPASEHFTLARKNGIESAIFQEVTEALCKSMYNAFLVAADSPSNSHGQTEALNTAQCSAGKSTNTLDDLSAMMATLQSKLTESSYSNTVSLWKLILAASSGLMNTFTTSTAANLTTDLKILKSCLSPTMQKSTHPNELNGQSFNVSFVESLLASVIIKLKVIANTDVQSAVRQDSVCLREKLSENLDSEFWTLCRKPLSESTVAKNVLKWGTGGINVDGCRISTDEKLGRMNNLRVDESASLFNMTKTKQNLNTSDLAGGRFPANLILDEEAAAALDGQTGILKSAGEYTDSLNKPQTDKFVAGNTNFGKKQKQVRNNSYANEEGGASRFFYVAKASKSDRDEGNSHPTVKPTSLMAYLCRLITPPGGTVLDPFAGSGSTGVAAIREGFAFVGIERETEYAEIAKARVTSALRPAAAPSSLCVSRGD